MRNCLDQTLIADILRYQLGKVPNEASRTELLRAAALALRRKLVDGMIASEQAYRRNGSKRLYYLSMEFLMGRLLENTPRNLDDYQALREALATFDTDLDAVIAEEPDRRLVTVG